MLCNTHHKSVFLGDVVMSASCRRLHLRLGVVVHSLGLEEDVPICVPPEVGDWVSTVATAC